MTDDLVERLRACPHYPYHDPSHAFFNGDLCMGSECVQEREAADRIEELEAALQEIVEAMRLHIDINACFTDNLEQVEIRARRALGDNHE